MNINRLVSTLIVGFVLLGLATIASAGKPEGKGGGGKAEEIASEAQLYDDSIYALRGDGVVVVVENDEEGGEHDTSLYQDANLSGECALVIATRIDKQSGTAFLWVPSPREDDNCDPEPNRWFESDYSPIFGSNVHAKIEFAGLYRPIANVMADGVVNVSIAIGRFRIAYPPTSVGDVGFADPKNDLTYDTRIVTLGSAPASICAWPTGKQKGKTTCEEFEEFGLDGTIVLPMKVKFTRNPAQ